MLRPCFLTVSALLILSLQTTSYGQTDLITNGDFEGGFNIIGDDEVPNGWTPFETFSVGDEPSVISDAADNGPTLPGDHATNFLRSNTAGGGDWTAIEQELNADILDCTSLTLSLDVKVISHNLYGGGCCCFEWPVILVVFYIDSGGNSKTFTWGWYIDPPGTSGNCVDQETLVAQGVWTNHVFDLLTALEDPATITKIRVGGSGWSFEGRADNVQVLCEQEPVGCDFAEYKAVTVPEGFVLETGAPYWLGPAQTGDDGTTFTDVALSLDLAQNWVGDLFAQLYYDFDCDGNPDTGPVTVLCRPAYPSPGEPGCNPDMPGGCDADVNGEYFFSDSGSEPLGEVTCPAFIAPGCFLPSIESCCTFQELFGGLEKGGCFWLNIADGIPDNDTFLSSWTVWMDNPEPAITWKAIDNVTDDAENHFTPSLDVATAAVTCSENPDEDAPHIAYWNADQGEIYYTYKCANADWPKVRVTDDARANDEPSLKVMSALNNAPAFIAYRGTPQGSDANVYRVDNINNPPLGFGTPLRISQIGPEDETPSFAGFIGGSSVIVWAGQGGQDFPNDLEIWHDSPTGLELLTDNDFEDFLPSADLDLFGKTHIAFVSNPPTGVDNEIWYATNASGSWTFMQLTDNDADDNWPVLRVDRLRGTVHIAWQSDVFGDNDIFHTSNDGGSFAAGVRVTSQSAPETHPALAIDCQGSAHIAYTVEVTPGDATSRVISYTNNVGGAFVSGNQISSGSTFNDRASMDIDDENRVHVAYHGNDGSDFEIYYTNTVGPVCDATDVVEGTPLHRRTRLFPPVPNPFNPLTTIRFQLERPSDLRLVVHDPRGRRVRTLAVGRRDAGVHSIQWDGRDDAGRTVPSGVYFLNLLTEGFSDRGRVVLLK